MTRTERALQAGGVGYKPDRDWSPGWVDDGLAEIEHAFERFLLALDDQTFAALLASLESQRK